ncbi:1-deoxy-D-xylulose-5-phosphate synthase N-terminal domain-containing protein [Streptomyces sp. NPDC092370]|uniref:1-deoxy-D-xylulose-5-phosphate synthase N-terminal domain-containing protein n=1 Tax=Streptomyces sp. NPDC092370 TaxID=3366016 RepID=UPI0038250380
MTIPECIRGPHDLKALSEADLGELSQEIREFPVHAVARTGDRLGPGLGVVELTVALHRVFESPVDRTLGDTGHQSHVHKPLTARQDFSKLRGKGGLSGHPSREESEHDVIGNSDASTALGRADGLAKARQVRGEKGQTVALIGDGALTGGVAGEALNNNAIPAVDRVGGLDVLHRSSEPQVLLVAVGVMAPVCLQAADLLQARGIGCTVVDPRWGKPVDPALSVLAAEHRLVAVVEDNGRAAGAGSAVAPALGDAEVDVPVRRFGIPEQFLPHAKRGEVLADIGLTPVEVAGRISASLTVKEELSKEPQE